MPGDTRLARLAFSIYGWFQADGWGLLFVLGVSSWDIGAPRFCLTNDFSPQDDLLTAYVIIGCLHLDVVCV